MVNAQLEPYKGIFGSVFIYLTIIKKKQITIMVNYLVYQMQSQRNKLKEAFPK